MLRVLTPIRSISKNGLHNMGQEIGEAIPRCSTGLNITAADNLAAISAPTNLGWRDFSRFPLAEITIPRGSHPYVPSVRATVLRLFVFWKPEEFRRRPDHPGGLLVIYLHLPASTNTSCDSLNELQIVHAEPPGPVGTSK